jgi:hypothetical protein
LFASWAAKMAKKKKKGLLQTTAPDGPGLGLYSRAGRATGIFILGQVLGGDPVTSRLAGFALWANSVVQNLKNPEICRFTFVTLARWHLEPCQTRYRGFSRYRVTH